MSLTTYEIFVTVAKEQSFSRASQVLALTPSAISHSITTLEKQMGFSLFIRNNTTVQLTDSGERLLLHAKDILHEKQKLDEEAAKIRGLETGSVRIGAFNSVCINWIPGIIRSFNRLHPNIEISVYHGNYYDVANWVKTRDIDIGFIITQFAENLEMTPLYKDRFLCVTPKDFHPRHTTYVTIDDIKNQSLISFIKEGNRSIQEIFQKYNLPFPNSRFFLDDQSAAAMVENGFGICIMPELLVRTLNFNIDAYPFQPDEYRTIGICTQRENGLSPAGNEFFKHIQLYIKSNGLGDV